MSNQEYIFTNEMLGKHRSRSIADLFSRTGNAAQSASEAFPPLIDTLEKMKKQAKRALLETIPPPKAVFRQGKRAE